MPMIRLTTEHPGLNDGKPSSLYIDSSRVLVIATEFLAWQKESSHETNRQATEILHQEVHRIANELNAKVPSMAPETTEEAEQVTLYMKARDAAAALMAAYGEVMRTAAQPDHYPRRHVTVISLACGTALEHGVMLSRVFVAETPDEVARLCGIAP